MGFGKIAKNYLSDYPALRHTSPRRWIFGKKEKKKAGSGKTAQIGA
jgi:hypothetical protein